MAIKSIKSFKLILALAIASVALTACGGGGGGGGKATGSIGDPQPSGSPCAAGQYLVSEICVDVGAGYFSATGEDTRTACPTNSTTLSTSAEDVTSCLGGVDFYSCEDGTCDAVAAGFYSPLYDNTQTVCSNMPVNALTVTYGGSGGGSDNCTLASVDSCAAGFNVNGIICEDSCGAGQYWDGGSCVNVGIGYWSPATENDRTVCTANRATTTAISSAETDCLADGGYFGAITSVDAIAVGLGYYSAALDNIRSTCPANSATSTITSSALADCLGNIDYYNCEDGTCDAVGAGFFSAALDNTKTACTSMPANATAVTYLNSGGGTDTCTVATVTSCDPGYSPSGASCIEACGAGQYWDGGSCSDVTVGYWSPASENDRTACTANRSTSNATADSQSDCLADAGYYGTDPGIDAVIVSSGYYSAALDSARTACPANSATTGTTSSSASDCLGDTDYYDCDDGTCDAVGNGYFSAALDNSRSSCTAMPTNATEVTYSNSGSGTDSCTVATVTSCIASYAPSGAVCVEGCGAGQYWDGGSCIDVGVGYWSPVEDNSRTACTADRSTSTATAADETDCLADAGYYGTDPAVDAGIVGSNYYSAALENNRTACPSNSATTGTTSSLVSDCLGDTDYYNCEDGTCDAVGNGYYSAALDNSRSACTGMPANAVTVTYSDSGSGTDSCTVASVVSCDAGYAISGLTCVDTCGAGQYWDGGSCSDVGVGYFSPAVENDRTACPVDSSTSSATSSAITDCLGNVDYYSCADGTCDAVANGFYSAALDNTQSACTGMPTNAATVSYGSSGGGIDNCTISSVDTCDAGYSVSGLSCVEACGAGQYWDGGSCSDAGVGYWSPAVENDRTACPTNSSTSGATSSAITSCLGDIDYYSCTDGTCDGVGSGYFSAALDNARTACTNMPTNATGVTYNSSGGGSNNCTVSSVTSCDSGYSPSGVTCVADNAAPSLDTNAGVTVIEGDTVTITTSGLSTSDADDTDPNITYAISIDVSYGTIKLDGVALSTSSTFTEQDIIDGLVTYEHTGVDDTNDSFQFSVKDDSNDYATGATSGSPATFSITVSQGTAYTSDDTFTVPGGVTQVTFKAWGAGGGGGQGDGALALGGIGGSGGYVEHTVTVSPSDTFTISIGSAGDGGDCSSAGGAGGYAGGDGGASALAVGADGAGAGSGGVAGLGGSDGSFGADGGAGKYSGAGGGGGKGNGAGGGGATVIEDDGTTNEIVIAGGGGGGGGRGSNDPGFEENGGAGGLGCAGAGGDAPDAGGKAGGGGGGGACVGDTTTAGTGQTPANSGDSGGAGYGGDETACNATDGKVIVIYGP